MNSMKRKIILTALAIITVLTLSFTAFPSERENVIYDAFDHPGLEALVKSYQMCPYE